MWFGTVACLISLAALGDAAVAKNRLSPRTDNVKLYAYGDGLAGYQIYYGADGKAYISNTTDGLTDITWTIDSEGTLPWNVTSTDNTTLSASFYIITDSNAYNQSGFIKTSVTPNTTVTATVSTTGFLTYGPYVMYLSDNKYVSEFWAKTTNTSGLWSLMWNQDGASKADSVTVSLKTSAPV